MDGLVSMAQAQPHALNGYNDAILVLNSYARLFARAIDQQFDRENSETYLD